ncbi:hypothetical protein H3Z83_07550 [Tenacibaculum sp. S7007]|uniref:Uncharacterized protein n=1 Tax=Tenacibaculum pelagium TaxID=2759527 RepID=A0A839APD4_9FLAO|nr:hypothetical protein [Tenacibaculum pelagium]MBA6156366.1 hypothetical protein [Tenacibaculum pelagium]
MKKETIKKLFKSVFILLFILGCQTDNGKEIEPDTTGIWKTNTYSERVTFKQLQKDNTYLTLAKNFKTNLNNQYFKSANNHDFTVNNDFAHKIEKENYTSYTFKVNRRTNDINTQENLILETKNGIETAFILKYQFLENSLQNIADKNNGEVKAKVWIEYLENYSLNNKSLQSRTQNCRWETISLAYYCHCEGHSPWESCQCNPPAGYTLQSVQVCQDNTSGSDVIFSQNDDGGFNDGGGGSGGNPSGAGPNDGDSTLMTEDASEFQNYMFNEQVFIDQDFKDNPCLKSVYDKMGKATTFNNYIKNFNSDMSVANLRFTTDNNFSGNEDADYHNAMAITKPPLANNEIKIKFNTDPNTSGNVLNKPDVFKAVSMIHELIHAEMYRKMLDTMITAQGAGTTLDWTDLTYTEFNQYLETLQNKYFGIWDYYVRYDNNDDTPDNGQHQAMAQHYREIIKQALTSYDSTLTNTQKEALSWIGLNEANIKAWQNLTQPQRDAINQTITQIKNTFPNGC